MKCSAMKADFLPLALFMPLLLGMSHLGLVSRVTPVQTAVRNCTRDEGAEQRDRIVEIGVYGLPVFIGAFYHVATSTPAEKRNAQRAKCTGRVLDQATRRRRQ